MPRTAPVRIVIIGAGLSGICLGIRLMQAGLDAFTILDRSQRPGGTWRANGYPGSACDTPAVQYCYSFEPKRDWTGEWARHDEIRRYIENCVQKYDLGPHIRFGVDVDSVEFDARSGQWRIHSASGEQFTADVLVSCVGQLNRPHTPAFAGAEDFAGTSFHSAQWNHDLNLSDRRVAVIGTGASAVQFIPQIAPKVAALTVFQRSANWIQPRGNHAAATRQMRRAGFPFRGRLKRWYLWWHQEIRTALLRRSRRMREMQQRDLLANLHASITKPDLAVQLIPRMPFRVERTLLSDDYYAALNRPNVAVETSPIRRIVPDGITTFDGKTTPVDTIIFATGFETSDLLNRIRVQGLDGRVLEEQWRHGTQPHLGIAVSGFPNLFMMYGPSTNVRHNSVLFMIECQARYITKCIRAIAARGLHYLDVRPHAPLHAPTTGLNRTACEGSRGRPDAQAPRVTASWPGAALAYWWKTREVDLSAFDLVFDRDSASP